MTHDPYRMFSPGRGRTHGGARSLVPAWTPAAVAERRGEREPCGDAGDVQRRRPIGARRVNASAARADGLVASFGVVLVLVVGLYLL